VTSETPADPGSSGFPRERASTRRASVAGRAGEPAFPGRADLRPQLRGSAAHRRGSGWALVAALAGRCRPAAMRFPARRPNCRNRNCSRERFNAPIRDVRPPSPRPAAPTASRGPARRLPGDSTAGVPSRRAFRFRREPEDVDIADRQEPPTGPSTADSGERDRADQPAVDDRPCSAPATMRSSVGPRPRKRMRPARARFTTEIRPELDHGVTLSTVGHPRIRLHRSIGRIGTAAMATGEEEAGGGERAGAGASPPAGRAACSAA
jgi:hypothetical protein